MLDFPCVFFYYPAIITFLCGENLEKREFENHSAFECGCLTAAIV
ncbi:MAG: hypothetical protein ACTTKL_05320 [Treponema sp.]